MSEAAQIRPSDSLLYSDQLFRVLGGDAMQILRCGICMEFFDVPIVLPCGHTFCLHCLTEMCKHASRNCVLSPLKDLRIGCPNCRVLIYVSPILERNVTCNFIIQSLIECLRSRVGGKRQNIGVNTDEVRVGSKIRTVNDLEMERVIKEVDRMTDALGKHNVIDNAYFEIDEIRRQHLAQHAQMQMQDEEQIQHKTRNQARYIQKCPKQLRLQQQPFCQQQQQQQAQQCQRSFSWEDFNNHFTTMTPSSSFHHQQSQQPNFKPHSKFQPQQQQQQPIQPPPPPQQQPPSQFQLRVQTQQQQQPQLQQQSQLQQQTQLQQQQPQLQHQQPQLQQVWANWPKISKMAMVLPLQQCPDIGLRPGALGQADIPPGHSSRLDNDPAVMSYSYKASIHPMANK
ncbi:hypothetical protein BsWGS_11183 [Bradybaena similaris]